VKHHSIYKATHYTSVLFKTIFPNSEIARKFSSLRKKAQEMINSVIAPHTVENRMQVFKYNTVSYCEIATDASNRSAMKAFPVVIHYRDWKNGGLQSKLIEVQQLSNIAAQTVVRYIKRTLENHRLLIKCIAFVGGKWNTMCGGIVEKR